MTTIALPQGKKVYFASDNHLGAPTAKESLPREKRFVAWLNEIQKDAGAVFLLGDLFDFWMEYRTVVPKGFTRTLGKLAEMTDAGIPIYFFVGNHDLWMNGYFEEELNIPVFHAPQPFNINGTTFFIGHGDGLGPHDKGYKRMKKVFTNPVAQWLFRWLHPDIGVRLAQHLSVKNKLISGDGDATFLGEDKEWLVQYCHRKLQGAHYDHFVFGHRHLPLEIMLQEKAKYTNLGDWIQYFTYGVFDGAQMELKTFGQP
ncbi:UDP-2,3-diacylglucosamine diphosphatase [Maribacter sp. 2307ULW6-5]|uniref:UDP-2,3-diacylglucosamine diphosphatase n=1 Tax=Maribacter sp. 2307ULW6-5 TaxID=3386275 RepID=UPI0039BD4664